LQFTLFFFSYYAVVDAGSSNKNDSCSQGNNRLQAGTFQFYSDCNSVTFCGSDNICHLKRCRKDDFPFGYAQDSDSIPDKCPRGQFCPDEADLCQDWIPVGNPCQLNRDDQCLAPPNFKELADDSNRGLNFNGSVCLNNICMWANVTEGEQCVVENTAYIGYGTSGEFIDIVSRGNCRVGLYCDAQDQNKVCKPNKVLGVSCDADKECDSWNCLSSGVCGPSADEPRELGLWVYIVVGLAILGGMLGTLVGLYFLHRRHRDQEREKRAQYWREQNAFHQNLLQMRETAHESHAPILQNAAPRASGLRYTSDDSSDIDEGMMMQPQMRTDGRF